MYSDARVADFINEHFIPVRVHVKTQSEEFKQLGERFGAHWTPTVLLVDASGKERHRVEGFLPADDFLAQLALGRGHQLFAAGQFNEAADQFEDLLKRHAKSDTAPEGRYWLGVARYKATGDASALSDTARDLRQFHPESTWSKKASVWSVAEAT